MPEAARPGGAPVGVSVPVTGLAPETTYYYRATATNPSGTTTDGTIESFTTATATAPVIESEDAASIEATAANLEATIAPGAAITTYQFDITEAQYNAAGKAFTGATTVAGAKTISPEETHKSVNTLITGLTPATTYVYRVVATNRCAAGSPCVTDGPTQTLTTAKTPGTPPETCPKNAARRAEQPDAKDLPDCRAYEIVSPAETGGSDATNGVYVRAAASGGAITYGSRGAFAEPASALYNSQLLSRREPERDRWSTRSINPPYEADQSGEDASGYKGAFFTADLTEGLVETDIPLTSAPEAAPAGLPEMYLADLASGAPSSYRLVSELPPSEAEYTEPHQSGGLEGVYALGASGDLSHVVFSTSSGAGQFGPMHEWVNGQVGFVAVSNDGEVWKSARLGNGAPRLPVEYQDVWRAVSENGERVIIGNEGQLYMREHGVEQEQSALNAKKECTEPAKACTVQVDAAEEGAPGPSGGGRYWGASVEGERVFFTDENKLTTNSTAESGDPDLYEYDTEPGHVYGRLTDLTVAEAGGHANVQGVMQISEDGSDVYFVAKGVLTGAEENQHHEKATSEEDNLYLSSGGHITFIATLSPNDAKEWENSVALPGAALAPGAAGGARLAFTSEKSLTGYDNEDASSKTPGEQIDDEVYLYDAETGALLCASCNPSGGRPRGSAGLARAGVETPGAYNPRDLLQTAGCSSTAPTPWRPAPTAACRTSMSTRTAVSTRSPVPRAGTRPPSSTPARTAPTSSSPAPTSSCRKTGRAMSSSMTPARKAASRWLRRRRRAPRTNPASLPRPHSPESMGRVGRGVQRAGQPRNRATARHGQTQTEAAHARPEAHQSPEAMPEGPLQEEAHELEKQARKNTAQKPAKQARTSAPPEPPTTGGHADDHLQAPPSAPEPRGASRSRTHREWRAPHSSEGGRRRRRPSRLWGGGRRHAPLIGLLVVVGMLLLPPLRSPNLA